MEQTAIPITDQVREIVETVVEALRVGKTERGAPLAEGDSPLVVANSFEAESLRAEIIRVGRKLWERQYVDGNGGQHQRQAGAQVPALHAYVTEQGRPDAG